MQISYFIFFAAAGLIQGASAAFGGEALLQGKIHDAATGRQTACTVSIMDATGKVVLENDSFRNGFRCSGEFSKRLPAGRTRIRITRGFETKAIEQDLNLLADETTAMVFKLDRTVNLRERGWFSGDSHAHMLHGERKVPVGFDSIALAAQAEDLQYLAVAQEWSLDDPTPENLQRELEKRSTPDCHLTWNLEAPKNYYQGDAGRCLGHCWNLGVRGRTREGNDVIQVLMDASAWDYESTKPTYANFESHHLIHEQGGVVVYSHPARWWTGPWGGQGGYPKVEQMRISNLAVELPLDTLIGPTFDGLDIITGSGEFEANAKAFEIWCLLLNHGYRITATGSSDACFDRPGGGVPGSPRVYTLLPGKFSFAQVTKAIAAGRTFVTTGPLLVATIDEKPPGTVFSAGPAAHSLAVEAWASGHTPGGLRRLEVLRNGQVWRELTFDGKPSSFQTNFNLSEVETSWYCVRAFGPGRQTAVTSAFYFTDKTYRVPEPVPAQINARVVDAQSGQPLSATLTEVTFSGTIPRNGKRHSLSHGEARLSIPGTARLRAEAKGYAQVTLSPFLDNPTLVKLVTTFDDQDLSNWQSYEQVKRALENVELVFRLEKTTR